MPNAIDQTTVRHPSWCAGCDVDPDGTRYHSSSLDTLPLRFGGTADVGLSAVEAPGEPALVLAGGQLMTAGEARRYARALLRSADRLAAR